MSYIAFGPPVVADRTGQDLDASAPPVTASPVAPLQDTPCQFSRGLFIAIGLSVSFWAMIALLVF